MTTFSRVSAFVIASLGAAAVSLVAGAAQVAPHMRETRGLWVLRTSLTSPESIAAMVRAAESGGFNTLLLQVRGRGESYYQSALEPRASDLDNQPGTFDPLATTLDVAHRAGLQVHAWISVNLVASSATLPRSRDHVIFRHPEWLMVPRGLDGELRSVDVRSPAYVGQLARWTRSMSDTIEGLYISPISADAREYTARVVTEIVSRYPVDGVHLDYARYPGDEFDYSSAALAEFRSTRLAAASAIERARLDRLAVADPAAWATALPDSWRAFRRDRLTSLVSRLRSAVRAVRPGVIISVAVPPDPDFARDRDSQDWRAWASAGLVDVLCPMAYATDLDEFTRALTQTQVASGRAAVWAGIGAYRLPAPATADRVRAARRTGAGGVVLFSYDSLATADAQESEYFAEMRRVLLEVLGGIGLRR